MHTLFHELHHIDNMIIVAMKKASFKVTFVQDEDYFEAGLFFIILIISCETFISFLPQTLSTSLNEMKKI